MPGHRAEVPAAVAWGSETLQVPSRPVRELGVELVSQATAAHHAGGSPSLLAALVIRLLSRRFRRRALRLLISST